MVILAMSVVALSFSANTAEAARRKKNLRPPPDRFAQIVIDADTGAVLSEKNADKPLYPASLTKMMTLYLTFDALERGTLSRNQRVYVSKRAASQEPSSLGLSPGETIRVEDAILAIATKSANDCAVVLAEAIEGSEDRFAVAMTLKARRLGMNNTHFVNASGLFKRAQVSTARDMALLSQALIRDHSRYYRYFSTTAFTYKGETYMNHNRLMSSYRGMDGLKTGYVYASGYNLASSAVRNGTRLIGVIFGGKTPRSRNSAMAQLLDRGFARVDGMRVASLASFSDGSEAETEGSPPFIPASLAVDQGDTDADDEGVAVKNIAAEFRPRPLNTTVMESTRKKTPAAPGKGWTVQIGAFSSHDASARALLSAKKSLNGIVSGVDSIAPLMTSRGIIYRARLSGLKRGGAAQVCRILKGTCLVLNAE